MKPKKACLSILKGVFDDCQYMQWIGPSIFDVWGMPYKKQLKGFKKSEILDIAKNAKKVYNKMQEFK